MKVPIDVAQFLHMFSSYNLAIWPAQLVLLALALAGILLASRPGAGGRWLPWILAALWLWAGGVFWIGYFTRLAPSGYVFGAAFLLQAVLFAVAGLRRATATADGADGRRLAGAILIFYALVFYPAIGAAVGHAYPAGPTFGAPCPTTIFTFGVLLLSARRVPVHLYLIPFAWSLVGLTPAIRWGVVEDYGLTISGLVATAFFALPARRRSAAEPPSGVGETPAPAEGIRRLH